MLHRSKVDPDPEPCANPIALTPTLTPTLAPTLALALAPTRSLSQALTPGVRRDAAPGQACARHGWEQGARPRAHEGAERAGCRRGRRRPLHLQGAAGPLTLALTISQSLSRRLGLGLPQPEPLPALQGLKGVAVVQGVDVQSDEQARAGVRASDGQVTLGSGSGSWSGPGLGLGLGLGNARVSDEQPGGV